MKKSNQVEFGIRSETGELYLLNKQERALTIEVLKMALATEGAESSWWSDSAKRASRWR